jgi:hypothetical protein
VGPFGSTLTGHAGERRAVLGQLAEQMMGQGPDWRPTEELVALLLPMVRRAVRTEHGPAALIHWLDRTARPPRPGPPTELATRKMTEDLVRVLFDPPGSPDDTLDVSLAR